MACIALTRGRGLDCNRSSGGVKYLYFAVFDQVISTTIVNSEVTDIDMGADSIYRYQPPRGTSQAMETITGSTDNGTIFYTPTVNMVLNRLSKEDQNEIKLLGQTQVIIFAQLNEQLANGHDVIIALGVTNAMALNAGTADSGTALADRNGYTLTFDGFEADPFPVVVDYSATPFDNADSGAQIPIITS
tara:strand:- start:2055 stop:2621 length:567 start_codon:yes stop_codon:yes gene_type:complete